MSSPQGEPVRVLHIVDSLGGGGAERWLWDAVRLMDRRQVHHRVVTVAPENRSWPYGTRLREAGAYPHGSPLPLWDAMPVAGRRALCEILGRGHVPRTLAGCARVAREYVSFRPDVIHAHVFNGLTLGAWLKAWTGRPLVYTLWCRLVQLRDANASWVIDDYRRFHERVDAFLTDPAYVSELEEAGVPADRIATFDGGVDVAAVTTIAARAAELRVAIRRRLGIPHDALLALSVGRLVPSKGHALALQAVARALEHTPALHWVVLGDGDQRAELESAAATHRLTGRAHFAGRVEQPHLFYAAADLYLRTALFEGENTSSHDAMAFGLPVAGFDTGCGTDWVRRTGHGILVPNRDTAALADAIIRILSLPDHGRSMGQRGCGVARAQLDIRLGLDVFTSTYRRLHKEHRAQIEAARLWRPARIVGDHEAAR